MNKITSLDIIFDKTTAYLDSYDKTIKQTVDKTFLDKVFIKIILIKSSDKAYENINGTYYFQVKEFNNTVDIERVGEKLADFVDGLKIEGNILIESMIDNFNLGYVLNGFALTRWYFDLYKQKKESKMNIYFNLTEQEKETYNILKSDSKSVLLCRYLSLISGSELNPETYTKFILEIFKNTSIKVKIIEQEELKKLNMNLILAVGNGALHKPRIIVLEKGENAKTAIVGKGITYDTGGLSLKDSDNMLTMYYDMTGSATVLSAILAIKDKDVNILGILPIAENAIGNEAYKPGDILISRCGKSIEVENTDAEGRLILADAAHYAGTDLKCENVICIGTLTGAVKTALGPYAALLSREVELSNVLKKSWEKAGEKLYSLPFDIEYEELVKSTRADMSNCNKGGAGTIFAWLFIKLLCPENVKYAGIDIASCTKRKNFSKSDDLNNGICVRGMIEFIKNFCYTV